jgi:hypothetical protein
MQALQDLRAAGICTASQDRLLSLYTQTDQLHYDLPGARSMLSGWAELLFFFTWRG